MKKSEVNFDIEVLRMVVLTDEEMINVRGGSTDGDSLPPTPPVKI